MSGVRVPLRPPLLTSAGRAVAPVVAVADLCGDSIERPVVFFAKSSSRQCKVVAVVLWLAVVLWTSVVVSASAGR
ncbi:MAG: hypothetical protein EBS76_09350 [Actinobacteria bacterium]|nr:hypothetical protein [Actinomycetota bacterium]